MACLFSIGVSADQHVVVVSWADEAYATRRNSGGAPKDESYVVMQGIYFPGTTKDRSLDKLDFMQVAQTIGVEIARSHYLPAKDLESADLLLVVHWGVTSPHVSIDDQSARTTRGVNSPSGQEAQEIDMIRSMRNADDPATSFFVDSGEPYREYAFDEAERVSDEYESRIKSAGNAALLGYTNELRKLSRTPVTSVKEESLQSDLRTERYFIIVHAYDLKIRRPNGELAKKPVWRLNLNMRSPGQNFGSALSRMSTVAREFAGKNLDDIQTVMPTVKTGSVEIGELQVIGVVQ